LIKKINLVNRNYGLINKKIAINNYWWLRCMESLRNKEILEEKNQVVAPVKPAKSPIIIHNLAKYNIYILPNYSFIV
jgi:hypothetical protein